MKKKILTKENVAKVLVSIVVVLIMVLILEGFLFLATSQEEEDNSFVKYNNGICSQCEGELSLIDVWVSREVIPHYIYECSKCHTIFETSIKK